jgi:hypothetical protein
MCSVTTRQLCHCARTERRRSESSILTLGIILHVIMFSSGKLIFLNCKSEDNVSDCLTKALPRPLLPVGLVGLGTLRV